MGLLIKILSPIVLINVLIALYSYALLPVLLYIRWIPESYAERIVLIGILSNLLFTIGCLLSLVIKKKGGIANEEKIALIINYESSGYSKIIFNLVYIIIGIYTLMIMQISAGSVSYFLDNLDKRQIFMQGFTWLTAPIFLIKYIFFYEYYQHNRFTFNLLIKFIFALIILSFFGRFFAVEFLAQLILIYSFISKKRPKLIYYLFMMLALVIIIFVYGLYRYYKGIVDYGQFAGSFIDYLTVLDLNKVMMIVATNFFDGADVLYKVLKTADQIGYLYGISFIVAIFKIIPRSSAIVGDYLLAGFTKELIRNDIGQQIIGILPELYANFSFFGLFLLIPLGYYLTSLYQKPKRSYSSIVLFSIIYINIIQLIRNGIAVFVTFFWVDILTYFLFQIIRKVRL